MTELTREQVNTIRFTQWLGEDTVSMLCDRYEDLRTDRDSWKATAEELADKNVNKALAQRHEMREARLRRELTEAKANNVGGWRHYLRDRAVPLSIQETAREWAEQLAASQADVLALVDVLIRSRPHIGNEYMRDWPRTSVFDQLLTDVASVMARPGVVKLLEGETP